MPKKSCILTLKFLAVFVCMQPAVNDKLHEYNRRALFVCLRHGISLLLQNQ